MKLVDSIFSNAIIYDSNNNLLLQYRVADADNFIPFDRHLGLFGGGREAGEYSTKEIIVRELLEETSIDNLLGSEEVIRENLELFGYKLCKLPTPVRNIKHRLGCTGLINRGYTHWINAFYSLQVEDVSVIDVFEGEREIVSLSELDSLDLPFMGQYDKVLKSYFNSLSKSNEEINSNVKTKKRLEHSIHSTIRSLRRHIRCRRVEMPKLMEGMIN